MKQVVITVGISASGKSTWASQEIDNKFPDVWKQCERDKIRQEICIEQGISWNWRTWQIRWEKECWKRHESNIRSQLRNPKVHGIIISDINLKKSTQQKLERIIREEGEFEISYKYFPITFLEACQRDTHRFNGVGISVIAKQWESWLEINNQKKYIPDPTKPPAYIFDLDGTLSKKVTNRKMFDWDRVHEDSVYEEVKTILIGLYNQGIKIIILSGRDGICLKDSKQWLVNNQIPFDEIFFKEVHDFTPDYLVKETILWEKIIPYYNILGVFEDRPRVCRMFRDLGIPVIQCGNPYIEH